MLITENGLTTLFLRLLCLGMTGTVHAAVLDDFSTVTAWSPGEPDRYAGKIEQVPGGAVVTPLKDTWGFVARRFSFTAEQVRTTPYLVVHVSKIEGKGLLVLKVITPDLQKDFVATAQKPGSYGGNLAESFRGLKKPLHLDVRLYAMGPKVRAHVSRLTLETTLPANAPLVWPAWTMPEDSRRVNGVWLHWEEGQAGIAKQPDPVPDEKVMTAIRVSPVEVDRRGALADIPEGGWIGQIGDSSVRAIIGEQRSHTRRLLAPRRALSLARAWRYHAGDSHGASLPVSKSSPQPNALYSFSSLVWPGQPLWAQTDWDDSAWQEVNVPTVVAEEWDESSFGWYRLRFRLPKDVRSVEQLRFDAVSAVAQVWLNGRYLGRQQNYHPSRLGWNRWPWCFDAADALELDDVNTLAVRTWMSGPQGIPGDVYLIEGSPGHVASIRVKRSNVRDDLTADYDFHLRLAEATGPLHARGEIRDLAGKRVITTIAQVKAEGAEAVLRWTARTHIARYRLHVTLLRDGQTIDRYEKVFFTTIIERRDVAGVQTIFLNGEPFFCKGFEHTTGEWKPGFYSVNHDFASYQMAVMGRIGANTTYVLRSGVRPAWWQEYDARTGMVRIASTYDFRGNETTGAVYASHKDVVSRPIMPPSDPQVTDAIGQFIVAKWGHLPSVIAWGAYWGSFRTWPTREEAEIINRAIEGKRSGLKRWGDSGRLLIDSCGPHAHFWRGLDGSGAASGCIRAVVGNRGHCGYGNAPWPLPGWMNPDTHDCYMDCVYSYLRYRALRMPGVMLSPEVFSRGAPDIEKLIHNYAVYFWSDRLARTGGGVLGGGGGKDGFYIHKDSQHFYQALIRDTDGAVNLPMYYGLRAAWRDIQCRIKGDRVTLTNLRNYRLTDASLTVRDPIQFSAPLGTIGAKGAANVRVPGLAGREFSGHVSYTTHGGVPTVAEYGEAQLPEPVPYATKPVDQAVSAPLRWTVAKPKRVLVDQYHSARFRLDDARPHGLRRLKQRLQQEGYEVLGWDKPVSTSVLHSVGVYIGLYPGNSVGAEAHGPEEVKALVEWTWYRHGRIVMLVQEGSGWGGSIRPIWAVSPSRLKGVGCDNEHGFRDQPHHLVFEAKDQSGPKSIWNGVTRIVMPEPRLGKGPPATRRIVRPYRSCFADVNGNGKLDEGEERVSPARICFAATHSEGNGRYAGVMSIRMFANGKEGQWGISVEDNARFFVNLVRHVQEPVPVYELPRELTMKRMEALVERARAKAEADKKKWDPIFERLKRQGRMGVPLSGP